MYMFLCQQLRRSKLPLLIVEIWYVSLESLYYFIIHVPSCTTVVLFVINSESQDWVLLIFMCLPYSSKNLPSYWKREHLQTGFIPSSSHISTHLNFENRNSKLHPHILRSRKNLMGSNLHPQLYSDIKIAKSNGLLSVLV